MAKIDMSVSEVQRFSDADVIYIRADLTLVRVARRHNGEIRVITYSDHNPADIPALLAALERAREIAATWAAESEASDGNS